jgi:hypothetical protein
MPVPRENCSLYLSLAFRAHVIERGEHDVYCRRPSDRHRERRLVMCLSRSQWHDGPVQQSSNSFDDVAVGHADAHDRKSWSRRRPGEERSFAFEDPDEPMKIGRVDETVLALQECRVNGGVCRCSLRGD